MEKQQEPDRVVRIRGTAGDYVGILDGDGFKDESRQSIMLKKATILTVKADQGGHAVFNVLAITRIGNPSFFGPDLEIAFAGITIWDIRENSELYRMYVKETTGIILPKVPGSGGIVMSGNN